MGTRLYALSVLCCNDHYCRLPYTPTLKLFPCLHLLRLKVSTISTRVRLPRANSAPHPLHHLSALTSLPLVPHISIALTFHPLRIEREHGNESIWKGRVSRVRMAWTTCGRDVAGAAHRWLSDTTRRARTDLAGSLGPPLLVHFWLGVPLVSHNTRSHGSSQRVEKVP